MLDGSKLTIEADQRVENAFNDVVLTIEQAIIEAHGNNKRSISLSSLAKFDYNIKLRVNEYFTNNNFTVEEGGDTRNGFYTLSW